MSISRGVLGDDEYVLLRVDRAQVCPKVCSGSDSDVADIIPRSKRNYSLINVLF
jgi:hypothetical protein